MCAEAGRRTRTERAGWPDDRDGGCIPETGNLFTGREGLEESLVEIVELWVSLDEWRAVLWYNLTEKDVHEMLDWIILFSQ